MGEEKRKEKERQEKKRREEKILKENTDKYWEVNMIMIETLFYAQNKALTIAQSKIIQE